MGLIVPAPVDLFLGVTGADAPVDSRMRGGLVPYAGGIWTACRWLVDSLC